MLTNHNGSSLRTDTYKLLRDLDRVFISLVSKHVKRDHMCNFTVNKNFTDKGAFFQVIMDGYDGRVMVNCRVEVYFEEGRLGFSYFDTTAFSSTTFKQVSTVVRKYSGKYSVRVTENFNSEGGQYDGSKN